MEMTEDVIGGSICLHHIIIKRWDGDGAIAVPLMY